MHQAIWDQATETRKAAPYLHLSSHSAQLCKEWVSELEASSQVPSFSFSLTLTSSQAKPRLSRLVRSSLGLIDHNTGIERGHRVPIDTVFFPEYFALFGVHSMGEAHLISSWVKH